MLTIKPPKQRYWRRFGDFFEHIPHLCSSVSIVKLEHVIAAWDAKKLFDFLLNLIPFSHNLFW